MGSQIEEWDVQTGQRTGIAHPEGGHQIRPAAWSPDSKALAGTSGKYDVSIWDAQGKLIHTLLGHTDWITALAWSDDGQFLASGSDDGSIRIWDARTGQLISNLAGQHLAVISVAWSPDGKRLASNGNDDRLLVWDVESREIVYERDIDGGELDWSPDGTKILSGGGGWSGRTQRSK